MIVERSIGWSKIEKCIDDLFDAARKEFDLSETELLIEKGFVNRLIFVGPKSDRYRNLLPELQTYCFGFIDAYELLYRQ